MGELRTDDEVHGRDENDAADAVPLREVALLMKARMGPTLFRWGGARWAPRLGLLVVVRDLSIYLTTHL